MTVETNVYVPKAGIDEKFIKSCEAVRITDENIEDVSAWCYGTASFASQGAMCIDVLTKFGTMVIDVKATITGGYRQVTKRAWVGYWVTRDEDGFNVFSNETFEMTFVTKLELPDDEVTEIVGKSDVISSEIVDQYFVMDPETDDLLPKTTFLANGMVVLVASPRLKANISRIDEAWVKDRALKENRWCRVTEFERIHETNEYRFVGVYADGTKRVRQATAYEPWIVKMDSIGESAELATRRYKEIYDLVATAMTYATMTKFHMNAVKGREEMAEQTTKTILDII